MNERDVLSRLAALPDESGAVHVDVDRLIATGRLRRLRRRAVAWVALGTAALVAGVIALTGQLGTGPPPPPAGRSGPWTVNSPDAKDVLLGEIAAVGDTDVWVVGYHPQPGLAGVALHWNGNEWQRFDFPKVHVLFDVTASSADDVWAVGQFEDKPVALHWDGSGWRDVPVPRYQTGVVLSAVAAIAANDVWAVGVVAGGSMDPLVMHWDGQRWQEVTSPIVPSTRNIVLNGMAARAADDIWAVGSSSGHPLALHWNGRQWSAMPVAPEVDQLTDVVAPAPDDVWVVSAHSHSPFHWDGRTWQSVQVPADVKAQYMTITPDGAGGLIAAGREEIPPCQSNPCTERLPHVVAARWNGTAWTRIPPPVDAVGDIAALSTTSTGTVWAVGDSSTGKPLVASISFPR
jgi:hypothetical protein